MDSKSCGRIRNFGIYANQPIPETNIVDAALILIAQSGAYKEAYLRFKRQPQNYLDLQQFFEEASDITRKDSCDVS